MGLQLKVRISQTSSKAPPPCNNVLQINNGLVDSYASTFYVVIDGKNHIRITLPGPDHLSTFNAQRNKEITLSLS